MRSLLTAMLGMALTLGYCDIAAAKDPPKPKEKAPAKARKTVEDMFNELDTNSDGKLTKDEFCANKKEGKPKETAEKNFDKYDTDKNGELNLEEFKLKGKVRPTKSK